MAVDGGEVSLSCARRRERRLSRRLRTATRIPAYNRDVWLYGSTHALLLSESEYYCITGILQF